MRRLLVWLLLPGSAILADQLLVSGGTLIDGTGGPPLENAQILIRDQRIERVGRFPAPAGARVIDARGKWVTPGFIDLHFHNEKSTDLAPLFLAHGVTSVRDPGNWNENFEPLKALLRERKLPGPRLFLCGPHLDGEGPAYPNDAVVIRGPEEARLQTRRQIAAGATAIKVYFRLPLDSIRAVVEEAHRHNVPVTAHLEIVNPIDAIQAGVDGIEHITSLGLALIPPPDAERYRQAVLANNSARQMGRYRMWASIDFDSPRVAELLRVIAARKTFVDPNLAVFERREGDKGEDVPLMVRATANMKRMVGLIHRASGRIVVGSHSNVPHAPRGWAYHREMEMLVESGLSPMDALVAATRTGAEFLGRDRELGTIEPGKLADLLVLDANPLESISNTRKVAMVLVGGATVPASR